MKTLISTDNFGGYTRYKILKEDTGEYICVIPDCGGILQELVLGRKHYPNETSDTNLYSVIDGVKESELPDNSWYKSSFLFPFPGRIRAGKYTFEGKTYQLLVNETSRNNALHGLVFDKKFVATITENDILGLKYCYDGSLEGYPFPFEISIFYTVPLFGSFGWKVTIKNTGSTNLPYGFGWHPYFKTGTPVDKLNLLFPATSGFESDKQMIPTGKRLPAKQFSRRNAKKDATNLENTIYDDCFGIGWKKEILLADVEQNLLLTIQQKQFDFVQLFTPPDRQCIAIEPQTCLANAFNEKTHLYNCQTLAPQQEVSFEWSIFLKKMKR
jgi:aldose 1-epimerase